MGYVSIPEKPTEVYHYTHRKNLGSILDDGKIRRFGDRESWFCASLDDTLKLMEATVMVEGKPYVKVGGAMGRYPKFQPEDYVILKLTPRWQNGEWVRWMQEMPPGTPDEVLEQARQFSMLKLGFRGDLKFYANPEIIEVAPILEAGSLTEWRRSQLLQRAASGELLTKEMFRDGITGLLPKVKPGAADIWSEFAKECIGMDQYVDFDEEPDQEKAMSRWYDTLLAAFARAVKNHGEDTATRICNLSTEKLCLYPWEMEEAALQIKQGANLEQLTELMNDGMLDSPAPIYPKLREVLEIDTPAQSPGMNMNYL